MLLGLNDPSLLYRELFSPVFVIKNKALNSLKDLKVPIQYWTGFFVFIGCL